MNKENVLNILVIEGTVRSERKSIHAANFVKNIGENTESINVTLVDPSELKLPGDGNSNAEKDPKYTKLTLEADAFFIVTPEYNHSYPGSLKRMLDSEYENYFRKPVAFAGVSSGIFGGARAIQSLLGPIRKMGMVPIVSDVYFQNSYELFDENGELNADKKEMYTKAVTKAFDELIWMARTLKKGREQQLKGENNEQ